MKRALALLLAAILALTLCAGCAKNKSAEAPAQSTSRPAAGITASAKAADNTAQSGAAAETPAPEPASAAEFPEAAVIGDPSETSFPGGLDDDGRGPYEQDYVFYEEDAIGMEGYEPVGMMSDLTPVEFLPLDGSKQYEANVFLSNFAEQGINLYFFDLDMSQILPSLVHFAHIWCKINDYSAISYEQLDGEPYEVLSLEKFRSVIGRFIPLNVTEESVENYYYPQEHSFYQDGKFYFEAADGEAYNRIAVADSLSLLEDGRYCLTFTEYEVDLDVYFDTGIPRSYYELTPTEAAQHQYLTRLADGYAIVTPYKYNGRDTYQLVEYTAW